jgi:hypothetical protein
VSYRVIFKPQVDRDLVDLWLESDHQRAMTESIDSLVRGLERDPTQVGESRGPQRRIALEWPVGIEFEIDEATQEVRIYRLWTFRSPNDADQ